MTRFNEVFCDWLDITFNELMVSIPEFISLLLEYGFYSKFDSLETSRYVLDSPSLRGSDHLSGVVNLSNTRGVVRLSLSGGAMEFLRLSGELNNFLGDISDFPHFITRLDAALDRVESGSSMIHRFKSLYPESCKLTRKSVRTTFLTSQCPDGKQSGTFYVGHRGSGSLVYSRVYDKTLERMKDILKKPTSFAVNHYLSNPVCRYEITVKGKRGDKRKTPCLRDVSDPTSVFWNFASPALLKAPDGVSDWVPCSEAFAVPRKPERTAYEDLERFLSDSPLFTDLAYLASRANVSDKSLTRKINEILGVARKVTGDGSRARLHRELTRRRLEDLPNYRDTSSPG